MDDGKTHLLIFSHFISFVFVSIRRRRRRKKLLQVLFNLFFFF